MQGQRVTEAKPFSHRLTMRPQELDLPTTEEASLAEAQKHMFKRNTVPKHVHESRPLEGVAVASTPKNPQDIFEVRQGEGGRDLCKNLLALNSAQAP